MDRGTGKIQDSDLHSSLTDELGNLANGSGAGAFNLTREGIIHALGCISPEQDTNTIYTAGSNVTIDENNRISSLGEGDGDATATKVCRYKSGRNRKA